MESIAVFRVIKNGWINFWRNFWLSATASLIMVVTLVILTLILLMFNLTSFALNNIQERVDISVYFKSQVSEPQILSIKDQLNKIPEISAVNYTSAQQALADFKARHQGNTLITDSLNQLTENPLPATLQIKAKQLDQYPKIVQDLGSESYAPYISKVNFEDNRTVIERLDTILGLVKKFGLALAIVFAGMAVLVIFNTIRLTIYNRREEVEIMQLVGATDWYIRWPFIIESILYAVVASVLTALLVTPLFHYIVPKINYYLMVGDGGVGFTRFGIWQLFGIQLAVALFLGILSCLIAIRRYLKV